MMFVLRATIIYFISISVFSYQSDNLIDIYVRNNEKLSINSCSKLKLINACQADWNYLSFVLGSKDFQSLLANARYDLHIHLVDGIYNLKQPLEIRWDSAVEGFKPKLILDGSSSDGGADAVIEGGVRLEKRADADREFSVPAAQQKAFLALNQGRLPDLYDGSGWRPVDRYPKTDFLRISAVNTPLSFRFNKGQTDQLRTPGDANCFAFGFWKYDWSAQILEIQPSTVDANDVWHVKTNPLYGIGDNRRVYLLNCRLDDKKPEGWVWRDNTFYINRPQSQPSVSEERYDTPVLESGLLIQDSEGVEVRHLTFKHFGGYALQSVRSRDIYIHDLAVTQSRSAVKVQDGRENVLRRVHIQTLMADGLHVTGGDRETLTPSGHVIDQVDIKDYNLLGVPYKPAVYLNGVGAALVSSSIGGNDHASIIFHGNNHLIYNNDIYDAVRSISDAGAIYTGRDQAARGNVILYNRISDVFARWAGQDVKGIYLDDQSSGNVVGYNKFTNVRNAVFIGGGRNNKVFGNEFYNSKPAIFGDARGLNWQKKETLDPEGYVLKSVKRFVNNKHFRAYENFSDLLDDDYGAPKYNEIFCNKVDPSLIVIEPLARKGYEIKRGACD